MVHMVHFHIARCSDISAGFEYLAPMGQADMMDDCDTNLQE